MSRKLSLFFFFLLLFSIQLLQAQRKVLHKTFDLKEAVEVNLDLVGDVEVEVWPGNVVMTETEVLLKNAAASVLNHFIENNRYDITGSDPDSTVVLVLTSFDKDREIVQIRRWKDGKQIQVDVIEEIKTRVFIPEEYESQNEEKTVWKLKPELLEVIPSSSDSTKVSGSP